MFGLFNTSLPSAMRASFENRAIKATAHIAGRLHGPHFALESEVIDCSSADVRTQMLDTFNRLWAAFSKNPAFWPEQVECLFEAYDQLGFTRFHKASTHLIAGLILTNMVCHAACAYPRDRAIATRATDVLLTNLAALDYILGGHHPAAREPGTLSDEILRDFEFAYSHYEAHHTQ